MELALTERERGGESIWAHPKISDLPLLLSLLCVQSCPLLVSLLGVSDHAPQLLLQTLQLCPRLSHLALQGGGGSWLAKGGRERGAEYLCRFNPLLIPRDPSSLLLNVTLKWRHLLQVDTMKRPLPFSRGSSHSLQTDLFNLHNQCPLQLSLQSCHLVLHVSQTIKLLHLWKRRRGEREGGRTGRGGALSYAESSTVASARGHEGRVHFLS